MVTELSRVSLSPTAKSVTVLRSPFSPAIVHYASHVFYVPPLPLPRFFSTLALVILGPSVPSAISRHQILFLRYLEIFSADHLRFIEHLAISSWSILGFIGRPELPPFQHSTLHEIHFNTTIYSLRMVHLLLPDPLPPLFYHGPLRVRKKRIQWKWKWD